MHSLPIIAAIISLVLDLLGFPATGQAEPIKIGYVDMQEVVEGCSIWKQAQVRLGAEIRQRERQLEEQRQQITRLKHPLEKPYQHLPYPGDNADIAHKYRQSLTDFKLSYRKAQEYPKLKNRELRDALLPLIRGLVIEVGKRDGYTLILEGNDQIILYGVLSVDLTDDMIAACNKKDFEQRLRQANIQLIKGK